MIIKWYYPLAIAALILMSSSFCVADSGFNTILATRSDVKWDAKSAIVADVTCDGKLDTIIIGSKNKSVVIGVAQSLGVKEKYKVTTVSFGVGNNTQDSLCVIPVRIETYPIRCENEDGALQGCKNIMGCSAFSLTDDACDSFNFYWDSAKNKLSWWRR